MDDLMWEETVWSGEGNGFGGSENTGEERRVRSIRKFVRSIDRRLMQEKIARTYRQVDLG